MGFFTDIENEISDYNDRQSSKRCQAYTADLAYTGCGGRSKQSKKINKQRKKRKGLKRRKHAR